jgi:hypothetical protein
MARETCTVLRLRKLLSDIGPEHDSAMVCVSFNKSECGLDDEFGDVTGLYLASDGTIVVDAWDAHYTPLSQLYEQHDMKKASP